MSFKHQLAVAALIGCGTHFIFADTIQLKDTSAITGKILAEKSDSLVVDVGYTALVVPRTAITSVSKAVAAAAGLVRLWRAGRRLRRGRLAADPGRARLARDLQHPRNAEPPFVRQAPLQGDPFEKLHENVGRALRCQAGVEDFYDVGVTDGAGGPSFIEETADQLRIPCQPGVQNLDGCAAIKQRVFGQVHLPKAALAEQPNDAVIAKGLACLQRHGFAKPMVLRAKRGCDKWIGVIQLRDGRRKSWRGVRRFARGLVLPGGIHLERLL